MYQISYKDSLSIIEEINSAPLYSINNNVEANYTQFIQRSIANFKSVEELKNFLIHNKENFTIWNQSVLKTLKDLLPQIIGSPESDVKIDTLKRKLKNKVNSSNNYFKIEISDYKECGLLIQEIIYDAQHQVSDPVAQYIRETIEKKTIRSNTFLLERLLASSAGLKKNNNIPYIVRNNFPSKKTFSDVLSEKKISTSESYDAIRKVIILLNFYHFWVNIKLGESLSKLSSDELFEIYYDETNALLNNCGYGELYYANPYDWIFLCSSYNKKDPLEYFRSFVEELLPPIS